MAVISSVFKSHHSASALEKRLTFLRQGGVSDSTCSDIQCIHRGSDAQTCSCSKPKAHRSPRAPRCSDLHHGNPESSQGSAGSGAHAPTERGCRRPCVTLRGSPQVLERSSMPERPARPRRLGARVCRVCSGVPQPPPSTMSCPASPSSRSRRDPGFQTDRGPHSRHGAECSHGRCQRSRTRSQAALRAVPSCLLLVVLIKALGVGFFVLEVMKKRKSLARPPCPTHNVHQTTTAHKRNALHAPRTHRRFAL